MTNTDLYKERIIAALTREHADEGIKRWWKNTRKNSSRSHYSKHAESWARFGQVRLFEQAKRR